MSRSILNIRTFVLMFLALLTFSASATNYTLWVNGRGNTATVGNYNDFSYWGPATTAAGVNKKAVNWDGNGSISSQAPNVMKALDCFCTGSNWCYIGTHSAGDLMTGYILATQGSSSRTISNATPNASGDCASNGKGTQVGWNIKWVRAASGAGGGSELADYGSWTTSQPLTQNLITTTARAMYNHSVTAFTTFFMYAGAKGTLYSSILPGQDDEAVAYHSSGAAAGTAGRALANPSDWFANDLTLGTAVNEGGSVKWSYHTVTFRDDNEAFNHYANGAWAGIISKVREAMASLAI